MGAARSVLYAFFAIHLRFASFSNSLEVLDRINPIGAKEIEAVNEGGCSIRINGGLPAPQPLILKTQTASFVLPDSGGTIHVSKGDSIRLVCSGSTNILEAAGTPEANVTCLEGDTFLVLTPSGKASANFSSLSCSALPYYTARYASEEDLRCPPLSRPIEIGFLLPKMDSFLRLIDGCYDNASLRSLYTRFDLTASISGQQKRFPRSAFLQGNFYRGIRMNSLFIRKKQIETISKILESEELGNKYVKRLGNYFLSRGHLTAKADFVYGAQQRATFHFLNAAPQWQTLNGNNWNALEIGLRDFASSSGRDLTIWTGTYGVATLPDENGRERLISMTTDENNNGQVEVPALFWKVALEPISGNAAAFVGVNNPYLDPVPESFLLCRNVCDELEWLTWSPRNVSEGYCYCCEVDELRKTIDIIPDFETKGFLK